MAFELSATSVGQAGVQVPLPKFTKVLYTEAESEGLIRTYEYVASHTLLNTLEEEIVTSTFRQSKWIKKK